jgi:antitoxin component HigA of HigAB toxin-antitoxin module
LKPIGEKNMATRVINRRTKITFKQDEDLNQQAKGTR